MNAANVFNPRQNPRGGQGFKKLPKFTTYLLPISLLFVLGGAAYALKWNQERQANPCINCQRQREIADEIYFGKKRKDSTSGCRI